MSDVVVTLAALGASLCAVLLYFSWRCLLGVSGGRGGGGVGSKRVRERKAPHGEAAAGNARPRHTDGAPVVARTSPKERKAKPSDPHGVKALLASVGAPVRSFFRV